MKKIVLIILAASIGFNLFFALGFVRMRGLAVRFATEEGRFRFLCEKMGVGAAKHAELWKMRRAMMREIENIRRSDRKTSDEFWKQIASDNPDDRLMQSYLRRTEASRGKVLRIRVDFMRNMAGAVTPEQRRILISMVRDAGRGGLLLKTN